MKLLERYLQAVKFWLPKDQRHDIAAELSEDIQSQVSEREAELGRKLDEAELEGILHRYGNPMLVAERYLPQKHLIGPELFPLYRLVLKIALLVWFLPWTLVWICFQLFDPAYREAHPGLAWMEAQPSLVISAVCFFTAVTLGFAIFDRSKAKARFLEQWSLRRSAALPDPDRLSRVGSIIEVLWCTFLALWWLDLRGVPVVWSPGPGDARFALTPVWQSVYWPALLYFVFGIVRAAAGAIRPYRTRLYSIMGLARGVFALVLVAVLLSAGAWVEFSAPDAPAAKVAALVKWANLSVAITLAIIGVVCVVEIVCDARRIFRGKHARPVAINGLAAMLAVGLAGTVVRAQSGAQNSSSPTAYLAAQGPFGAISPNRARSHSLRFHTAPDGAVQLPRADVCLKNARVADSRVPSRPS